MGVPFTPQDFVRVGARFASVDIVREIDRLVPLAKTDATGLAAYGYDADDLTALEGFRAELVTEDPARQQKRAGKKGARASESEAVVAAKRLLRGGVTIAHAALDKRAVPAGETEDATRAKLEELGAKIDALSGRVGLDSAKLRARLTGLLEVLALPDLAPSGAGAATRAAFVAKVQAALGKLPALAEAKTGAQQSAMQDTDALDEIDGRAYTNMKRLVAAGRAYFNEVGNGKRAGAYQLSNLNARATNDAPAPAPSPPTPA